MVLERLGYSEVFVLTDVRLGLGLFTVACAAVLFYIDKKLNMSWDDAYWYTVALVAAYSVGNVGLWYFNNTKYKNVVYTGANEKKTKLSVATTTERHKPVYVVTLKVGDDESRKVETTIEYTKLFDSFGTLHHDELAAILQKELEKVGKKSD